MTRVSHMSTEMVCFHHFTFLKGHVSVKQTIPLNIHNRKWAEHFPEEISCRCKVLQCANWTIYIEHVTLTLCTLEVMLWNVMPLHTERGRIKSESIYFVMKIVWPALQSFFQHVVSTITCILSCSFTCTALVLHRRQRETACLVFFGFQRTKLKRANSVPKPSSTATATPAPPSPLERRLKPLRPPFWRMISPVVPVRFLVPAISCSGSPGRPTRRESFSGRGEIIYWRGHRGGPESPSRTFSEHGVGASGRHHLRGNVGTGHVIREGGHERWAGSHWGMRL